MSLSRFSLFLISEAAEQALVHRSEKSGVSVEVLSEVFDRGIVAWEEDSNKTPEQYAFNRVDSFIAGGLAAKLDKDLVEDTFAIDISGTELNEGKRIKNKVQHGVVKQKAKSVVRKYTQKHKAMYSQEKTNLNIQKDKIDQLITRKDHLGRKIDARGHIKEGKEFLDAKEKLHMAHHESSRQLAGTERDPELRRIDLHRAKKHLHAARVIGILKATTKSKNKK